MLPLLIQKQWQKNYLLLNLFYFIFFVGIYTWIDFFNMDYASMSATFGIWLVLSNIALNLLMAFLSMAMLGLTGAQFELTGKESSGSNLSIVSVFFGILTYGCTPCVIAFFAAIGISFSVLALPFAGLPYKLISLALLLIGLSWVLYSIRHSSCSLKGRNREKERT